ncbi:beta-L-arabinofuranosidase domain-containing protein [Adhaeribacter pallidiroseus]|nr:beta-L-arabinofuranosidase domain-containing protein [Adhaeribacter pallidiroseus]
MLASSLTFLFCTSFKPVELYQTESSAIAPSYVAPVYKALPLGAINPKGWLHHQLQIMRKGTTGHLDEIYPKVKNDNGWLGGKGDAWEETPYWLDGAVPLAYLLEDKVLQTKVLRYINWTLDNQRPSGYFGPITKEEREKGVKVTAENCGQGEDWWPKMVMLKVMHQYYTATQDSRVIPFFTKYFNYQLKSLKQCPIGKWTDWAESRGTENVMLVQWLYGITQDPSLLELAGLIESQSFAWSTWLGNRDWVIGAATQQNDEQWMRRHGVNVAMAIKAPAINYQRTQDKKYLTALNTGFNDLMTLHGLPMGIFSSDEDLHGNDPTQGTELCTIVETMFSLEEIIGITGDLRYADALERMTFNALPTQTTDDYYAKQYFQIANQVQVKRGVFNFSLPFEREMNNVYGMRSGYTCCLANMHQGWTKFTQHLWYGTADQGVIAMAYSPNQLKTKVGKNNTAVTINEVTNYPFEDVINFEISTKNTAAFSLQLRVPAWCQAPVVKINGQTVEAQQNAGVITLNRTWKNKDKVLLQLPMEVTTSNWGRNSRSIERGPLVYALKLEEKWEKGTDEKEGNYWNVFPKSAWNYGLLQNTVKEPAKNLQVKNSKPVSDSFVWNLANAPLEITAMAKKIPDWQIVNDVAPQPVTDRTGIYRGKVESNVEKITLVPYGCTKVRIVAFPVVPN